MKLNVTKLIGILVLIILIGIAAFLIGYFKFLVICILVSLVLALIGGHLMSLLKKAHIGRLHISPSLAAGMVMVVIVGVVAMLSYWIFPLLFSQVMQLANIDSSHIVDYANKYGVELRQLLINYGIIEDTENSFEILVNKTLLDMVRMIDFKQVMSDTVSTTANILMGVFTILFLTFFFLRDRNHWRNIVYSAIPDRYTDETQHIFHNSRRLISRYFIGLL
ncbi:MAG: AI-2E family transporter, partial [Bacteroidales bacterium]|nr:AI-2E family transporter [Bacteroidales bacterium]